MPDKTITWDRNGEELTAVYSEPEQDFMREMTRKADAAETPEARAQIVREITLIHELKARLDARMIEDESETLAEPEAYEQSLLFPVPEKARRELERRGQRGQPVERDNQTLE